LRDMKEILTQVIVPVIVEGEVPVEKVHQVLQLIVMIHVITVIVLGIQYISLRVKTYKKK